LKVLSKITYRGFGKPLVSILLLLQEGSHIKTQLVTQFFAYIKHEDLLLECNRSGKEDKGKYREN
jgi:hypothetical protein